jgi:hypothetical protein
MQNIERLSDNMSDFYENTDDIWDTLEDDDNFQATDLDEDFEVELDVNNKNVNIYNEYAAFDDPDELMDE